MSCTYKMLMVFLVAACPQSLIQGEIRLLIMKLDCKFCTDNKCKCIEMRISCYKQSLIGSDQKSWFDPRLVLTKFIAFRP